MNISAIFLMLVAIILVWGGLAVSAIHLKTHPLLAEDEEPVAPLGGDQNQA